MPPNASLPQPLRDRRVPPPLDAGFRPMALARAGLLADIRAGGARIRVVLAVEQPGGSVWHREMYVDPPGHPGQAVAAASLPELR